MARSGPVPVMVEIQKAGAGAFLELEDLTNIGGLMVTAEKVDTTAFRDEVKQMGPTGVRSVSDLELTGFFDPDADTAFTRIGRPATDPSTTPDMIRVTYQTGSTRTFSVLFDKNEPVLSLDNQTMFEATAYQAGQTLTESF